MRRRGRPDRALLELCRLQGDVCSKEQALGLGLTGPELRGLLDRGSWQRVARGMYLCHNGPIPWRSLVWAGLLTAGDRAAVGGEAAAHLLGLGEEPGRIDYWIGPQTRVRSERTEWNFRRDSAGWSSRARGMLRTIGVEDLTLDLCTTASRDDEIVDALTAVLNARRTTLERLLARARQRCFRNRRRVLAILHELGGIESVLEHRYLLDVERAHALPVARRQLRHGRSRTRSDVAYEEYGSLIELDGRAGHTGRGAVRDLRRDNGQALLGRVTLRFGWSDVHGDPCAVAAQVARVLHLRGWDGHPGRCRRCHSVPDPEWWQGVA
ncbi:hypothetical protein ACF3NT_08500 [Naumannella halotolerans]|uniref:hypothetical protein n=1 Tax=Naumannella halotolerans TaxID=993414 RepID=UPI00370D23D1